MVGAVLVGALVVALPGTAPGVLDTPGFRAVGVAHAEFPISALAVAPDGRLFAAVQALGRPDTGETGTAEIRVYSAFATNDGSTLDEGTVWATVTGLRATNNEEGLIGLALAPDFATSGLVYVYVTTTDADPDEETRDQEVWVLRENASGTGDLVGAVLTGVEPTGSASSVRNGGALGFGADGCLYLGVGDNNTNDRWSAQVLRGTDPWSSSERDAICQDVCRTGVNYPHRPSEHDDQLVHTGKLLRLAVEGPSTAQSAPAAPLARQPFVFGAGLRNPVALATHPLTGQLYLSDRADSQEAEVGVADLGSNHGWPCLEGGDVATSGVAPCLAGLGAADVYAKHPDWRRPLATHPGNGEHVSAIAAYTGLGYPAEYYGDVFYLLRSGARIYRMDLEPPCFLPHPNGVDPLPFHDSDDDGDFRVNLDIDDDGDFENVNFQNLVAIAQAANPLGQQVLYVAGKQGNGNQLEDDTVIFRIEYATAFTPYAGPTGRVADACFTDGTYSGGGTGAAPYGWENPFLRPGCQPPGGPCPGSPDGTSCDDGETCNGTERCESGICRASALAADGTACLADNPCRAGGVCQSGACLAGSNAADGTPCPDGDPCNGLETCAAGVCRPGSGPAPLDVKLLRVGREQRGPGSGSLLLRGSFQSALPVAPDATDDVTIELRDGGGMLWTGSATHPGAASHWRRSGRLYRYRDKGGTAAGLSLMKLRARKSGQVQLLVRGRHLTFSGLDETAVAPRVVVGDQCFATDLSGCTLSERKLVCR